MPWVVGIDEAGYGPNLGPLVQSAVALRLPDDDPGGQVNGRPPSRCMCRCGTVCPAPSLQLITSR